MVKQRRFSHLLKHNQRNEAPTEFIFVDCETKGVAISPTEQEHHLWFGYALYLRLRDDTNTPHTEWFYLEDIPAFWDWVESKMRPHIRLWLFAHNTAFDFRILKGFTELNRRGWQMGIPIFERMKFLIRYRKQRSTLIISDTMNYFPVALKELGRSIGLSKGEMPSDTDPLEVWQRYCKRDVEVIAEVIQSFRSFLQLEDLGNWGMTAARQALNAFSHRFMSHNIRIHDSEKASDLELAAYHGGRVEAFRIGKLTWPEVYKLDVNSMYPFVMRANPYPTGLREFVADISPATIAEWGDRFLFIGYCELDTPEPVYPYRQDDKLLFPTGHFATYLTHPEIMDALRHGYLIRLIEGYTYFQAPLFTAYVDYFYGKRQEYKRRRNDAFQLFCKMMLNSLYGKFAQRVPESIILGKASIADSRIEYHFDMETGERWREITIGGITYKEGERTLGRNSFPAISACVTGYARIYLWELIRCAGLANVAYCDTDSLLVNEEGYTNLSDYLDANRLGALKLEAIGKDVVVWGLKDYRFDDVTHIKGVRVGAPELAPGIFESQQVPGIRSTLLDNESERVVFQKVLKHLNRDYAKGTILGDGTIEPYRMNEVIHPALY